MNNHKKRPGTALDQFFARAVKPSDPELQLSKQRVLQRLMSASDAGADPAEPEFEMRRHFNPLTAVIAAAAAVLLVASVTTIWNSRAGLSHRKMAEAAAGTLYRNPYGNSMVVRPGESIERGETVRADDDNGAVVVLSDGSRIEMRSQSEVTLEEANDGVRIRLMNGSVIVNAAKQRTGHLYVQTRDVTVSVVGTVFLVESVEAGSRVAVIQGEVHVQQGSTLKKLLPGEQVATAPSLALVPVVEEISWSRNIEAHRALLEQAALAATAVSSQNRQARQTFEAVSITPRGLAAVPPGVAGLLGAGDRSGCVGRVQLDPKRLFVQNTTLYNLITLAYGLDCRNAKLADLISGGGDWIRSDKFDIDAAIPDGVPSYTAQQLNNQNAPILQLMIQTMLADRFKLAVHHETKETPVYNLIVVTEGKLKLSENQDSSDGLDVTTRTAKLGEEFFKRGMLLGGGSLGMIIDENGLATIRAFGVQIPATFTLLYTQIKDRPIVDKTNLKGRYDLQLQFATMERVPMVGPSGPLPVVPAGPSLFDAVQDQLGLKLDSGRVPMDITKIDRAEKPAN